MKEKNFLAIFLILYECLVKLSELIFIAYFFFVRVSQQNSYPIIIPYLLDNIAKALLQGTRLYRQGAITGYSAVSP